MTSSAVATAIAVAKAAAYYADAKADEYESAKAMAVWAAWDAAVDGLESDKFRAFQAAERAEGIRHSAEYAFAAAAIAAQEALDLAALVARLDAWADD